MFGSGLEIKSIHVTLGRNLWVSINFASYRTTLISECSFVVLDNLYGSSVVLSWRYRNDLVYCI